MKVLLTDPISATGKNILEKAGIDVVDMPEASSARIAKALDQIDAWIIRSGTKITAELLNKAKRLKVVGRAGVGVDNIDIPAATLQGVVVMNTPGVNTVSAAEHTIALLLTLARNVHKGYSSLRKRQWARNSLVGTELRGKTLGVIGLGKVGTEVVKRLHGFGMKVLGHDPYVSPELYELDYLEFRDLDSLCQESDIITLHVPLTDGTRSLFDMARFKTMKPSALIVNCARGGIIVEEDLAEALDEGIIAGAAVDVFADEPVTDSPLLSAKNILFTPHLGASTVEAREGVSRVICENVRDFLLSGRMENALNIPVSDPSLLHTLKPYLELAEKLGTLHQQLSVGHPGRIAIETQGSLQDVKLITLAFLKGFLEKIHGSNVNFVNAIAVAESHGINVRETYGHGESDYSNLIAARIESGERSLQIRASLFSDKHPRIVYFDGFHLDLTPTGNLLIVYNKDVPGVVGKVGTFLGNRGINIAGYQLSRKVEAHHAMGIIRLDSPLDDRALNELTEIEEIIAARQVVL